VQSVSSLSWQELLGRLGLALLVGAAIGWEREVQGKAAGLRTNMLVSFGAALFVLILYELGFAGDRPDALSRVIQGVTAGVGFIGGGAILHGKKARGLTSAAAIWVSAALGVVSGCGLWRIGLIGAFSAWIVLWLVEKVELRLLRRAHSRHSRPSRSPSDRQPPPPEP
jgi:putative Mg2+ transporter-C (MgtC) family protein